MFIYLAAEHAFNKLLRQLKVCLSENAAACRVVTHGVVTPWLSGEISSRSLENQLGDHLRQTASSLNSSADQSYLGISS